MSMNFAAKISVTFILLCVTTALADLGFDVVSGAVFYKLSITLLVMIVVVYGIALFNSHNQQ